MNPIERHEHGSSRFEALSQTLDLLADRWTLLILDRAHEGVRRFGVFRETLGISRQILTDRLNRLVKNGLLERTGSSTGPEEYVATSKGRDVFRIICAFEAWSNQHEAGFEITALRHRGCGCYPAIGNCQLSGALLDLADVQRRRERRPLNICVEEALADYERRHAAEAGSV